MGVSLQIYRVRIGTYTHAVRVKTAKEQTDAVINKFEFKWSFNFKIVTAILLLSLLGPFCTLWLPWTSTHPSSWTSQCLQLPSCKPSTQFLAAPPARSNCTPTSYFHLRQPNSWLTARVRNSLMRAKNGNRSARGRGIKLIAWNKGSSYLQNKHHEIEHIIAAEKPHILGLSEANLKKDTDLSLVQHAEYTLHTAPTIDNPQLGIARMVVYTHSSLVVKRRHDLEDQSLSAVWLELGMPRQKKIIVGNIYREWQYMGQASSNSSGSIADQLQRWLVLIEMWEKVLNEGKEVMVLGDINLDFLKWNKGNLPANDSSIRLKQLNELVFNRIFPHGVKQLVTTPTRLSAVGSPSGLDHIYTNRSDKCSEVQAEIQGGSDHKLIKITRFSKVSIRKARYVKKRSFKNFCPNQFCEAVKQISWYELYMCDSPSKAADILTKELSNILDRLAPVRTIQVRTKYAAWLSDASKIVLQERNEAQKRAAESKDPDDWRAYRNLRNTATARLRAEKREWEKQKLDGAKQNPATIWRSVKSWLSWGNTGPPSKLYSGGEMLTSPYRVSGAMNSFFINKVRLLREKIPEARHDPLNKLRESMKNRSCSFSIHPVFPSDVEEIIKDLKNSKSTGVDYIDTWVIKLVAKDILPAITHIVNLSILHSEFPTSWKLSKVVPLLKKGDPLEPKNYRPVALLPIFSKILEKAIFLQLVKYLDTNCLFHSNHHGSRRNHNTATALVQMYDKWLEEVEEGKMVGVMMVDLSAAFDMVDHKLLLAKLELFGLDDNALNWVRSYLSQRSQSVCVDGCLSPPLPVVCGVPQGSILGPLFYVLFTSDIPDLVHSHPVDYQVPQPYCSECGSTVCYVDDCTYSLGGSDPAALSESLSIQYHRISEYMAANKLVINAEKTHLIVMGTKATAGNRCEVALQAGDHTIRPTHSEKLLGGYISENLKWREHLLDSDQSLVRQLTSRINGLVKVGTNADFSTRLLVANGIFASKLCYLIQLWGGTEAYLLSHLQILQNRAARAVTGKSWFTPTRQLLKECRWLSVCQLVFYQTVLHVHKIILTGKPDNIRGKLITEHPYQTRLASGGGLRLENEGGGRSGLRQKGFLYRGTQSYNSIPSSIRKIRNLKTFKHKLKQWVRMNIPLG